MKNALDFIKSYHRDFKSFNAIHFAVDCRKSSANDSLLFVGIISLKGIDLVNKKASQR